MNTDLLIEIGTEELPTHAVEPLSLAFAQTLLTLLDQKQIDHQLHYVFATPRRIGLLIKSVASATPAQMIEHRGPPKSAAFNAQGAPTPAAIGFAQRFNIEVQDLATISTEKGDYLIYHQQQAPLATETLLLGLIEQALNGLPIKKPMSWGAHTFKFVRPVHWALVLFGDKIIPGKLFEQKISNQTRGHRFLHNEFITIDKPEHYAKRLFEQGYVVANFAARKNLIQEKMTALAQAHQLHVVVDEDLLTEVTCLVEWPVALLGQFDPRFLSLPPEVISCTLKQHQKTFVLVNAAQQLQPNFISIANIESKDPQQVIKGNEKVVHARLSDAAFFFAQDKKLTLEQQLSKLAKVIFQQNLGTLLDKSERIAGLMPIIAPLLKLDTDTMKHAALLCKADLTSFMVNEFPELQGIMGAYYAHYEQQDALIVSAIREHYQPQGANDTIPYTLSGTALSIADKIDTLAGIFALGKRPSGDKDPFALKRAMIGILRMIIEQQLPLDLKKLFSTALTLQPVTINHDAILSELLTFAWDRLEALLREAQFPPGILQCVTATGCTKPYDMYLRLTALKEFMPKIEALSLASAHKRVNNLLAKQSGDLKQVVNPNLLQEDQEKELAQLIHKQHDELLRLCQQQNYAAALLRLAELKPTLDAFFDKVLVLCEDEALKQNRLALLRQLNALFLIMADFSHLPVAP